jgi:hypothetical protein
VGVRAGDTRDTLHRHRFLALHINHHLNDTNRDWWLHKNLWHELKQVDPLWNVVVNKILLDACRVSAVVRTR